MNLKIFINSFIDIILPPRCVICKKHSQGPICQGCLSKIEYIKPPFCKVCGKPHDRHFEGNFCHDCYLKKTSFDSARSIATYKGMIKTALHKFKFNNKHILRVPLGKIMLNYLEKDHDINLSEIDAIIPIPLSRKKLKSREYNQAKLLAEELSKSAGIELDDLSLQRTRETIPQFNLSREERLKNLKDAFSASSSVEDKAVLLIDDIYTTGSTVREASTALKRAGAQKIYVLTLARAIS